MDQVKIVIPLLVIVPICRMGHLLYSSSGQVQFREVIYSEHNQSNHLVVTATIRQATVLGCRVRASTSIFASIESPAWFLKEESGLRAAILKSHGGSSNSVWFKRRQPGCGLFCFPQSK